MFVPRAEWYELQRAVTELENDIKELKLEVTKERTKVGSRVLWKVDDTPYSNWYSGVVTKVIGGGVLVDECGAKQFVKWPMILSVHPPFKIAESPKEG